nr:hypothetical protein [Microbacterium bovistercoris]
MRTTVDLPPAVHRRVKEMAREQGGSVSGVIADLTVRGLAQLGAPVEIEFDPRTRLPAVSIGRRITDGEVVRLLDEE